MEIDAENDPSNRPTTEPMDYRDESEHHGTIVQRHGMLAMGESQELDPANQNLSATEVRVGEFEDAYHMGAKLACFGKPIVRDDTKKREKPGDAGVLESRRQGSDQW